MAREAGSAASSGAAPWALRRVKCVYQLHRISIHMRCSACDEFSDGVHVVLDTVSGGMECVLCSACFSGRKEAVIRELNEHMLEWARQHPGFACVLAPRVPCLSWLLRATGLRVAGEDEDGANPCWRLCAEDPLVNVGRDGQPEASMESGGERRWVRIIDLMALNNLRWRWQGPARAESGCKALDARWADALRALVLRAKALPPVRRKNTIVTQ